MTVNDSTFESFLKCLWTSARASKTNIIAKQ